MTTIREIDILNFTCRQSYKHTAYSLTLNEIAIEFKSVVGTDNHL